MNAVRITVNREMDGFTFSILPSVRDFIYKLFPGSHPASRIFIVYDMKSVFDLLQSGIEKQIYPTLIGVDNEQLNKQVDKIDFVNSNTGNAEKINA